MRYFLKVLISFASFVFVAASPSSNNALAASYATYPVGNEPKAVVVADFNKDGKQDLATVNRGSYTVSILLGDGLGNFGAASHFPTGGTFGEPFALIAGDFNNDGKTDVVVSKPNVARISLLLGNGAGGLGTAADVSVGENPATFTAGDFNGDGNRDLAVADFGFNNGGVYVLLGTGTGTGSFGTPTKFTAGTRPRYVATGDFNRDNKTDLAVANVGFGFNKVSILIGNGTGGFNAPTDFAVGTSPIGLVIGDFNKDNFLDLAVANTDSHNVSILKGDGLGSFGSATNFPANSFPLSISSGDFDGDGKLDLAVGANSTGDRISILRGDDTGQFSAPSSFSAGSGPYDLVGGDLNGDGSSDLAVANASSNNVSVWIGPLPSVSIAATSVTEGNTGTVPANFPLTLSASSNRDVTLTYSITHGTTSAADLGGGVPQAIIPAGNLTGNLAVPIIGEQTYELNETFTVTLTTSLNAFINISQAQGTIVNDDPIPSVSIEDSMNLEGSNISFNITLTNPSFQQISVTAATADRTAASGSDYVAKSSTVNIPAGQTGVTFSVLALGDTLSEPHETFLVNLTSPTNASLARAQAIGTILDNDPAALLVDSSQRAIATDSITLVRDPFAVANPTNFSLDQRSRISLFAVGLNLNQGDVITVSAEDAQHVIRDLPVEFAGPVPTFGGMWQIVVKLPDNLTPGDYLVRFTLRGTPSNTGLITIKP
ncbi:MAG TPA: FG-GAP-like repeat-containing protein [Pyrinomonadaceae bacterium]